MKKHRINLDDEYIGGYLNKKYDHLKHDIGLLNSEQYYYYLVILNFEDCYFGQLNYD